MKSLLFKSIFMLMLTIGIVQTSSAYGYYHRGCGYGYRGYYSPRAYCGPRYYGPRYVVPGPYYRPVYMPGHWAVNPYGVRIWVDPCYR